MKLKKMGLFLMSIILVFVMVPGMSSAAKLSLRVELNGERILFPDAQPYVDKNNRVQVPVRFVSEALGAKVGWKNKTQEVTIEHSGTKVILTINKKAYKVNESTKLMDTAALTKSNRTFVPLRFVSEALGAKVKWDSANYTVEITTGDGATAASSGDDNDPTNPASNSFDYEAFRAARSIEGKTEKKTSEGYSYYEEYESGLIVSDSRYKKEYGNTQTIMNLLLTVGRVEGDNLEEKANDAEGILRQKVDSKTADAVMKYVRQKKNREDELPEKLFKDDTYKIVVESKYWNNIVIEIWYK
ncbi:copper amine oxidase N-terminal domain-containing protein [Paenibacillus sp. D2_2]|uniref:copper amine oxidase N-terminal domain-containing protein n=1 Tax=Paenibacillus sp. D2_2 TaxID=3073092 RepID=UPI00281517A8|nr:copper amine oxidase N-terminal domain-containing protein [Paenibacillus sp. D2_2]WMT42048.1 copper amine oxidase N-terminal domain-containing protein [Paenibacillus sp. D2_2]